MNYPDWVIEAANRIGGDLATIRAVIWHAYCNRDK